jgi:leader peptidase (prepilin peptidase)/N-methyltransferase
MFENLQQAVCTWPVGVFVFLVGLCVGSFLNVCIYRLPAEKSLVWPPSHCTSCQARIAWYDNIPVASYFILGGHCRKCGAPFSVRYMVVELATGLLLAGYWLAYFPLGLRLGADHVGVYVVHMVLIGAMLVSGVIDFESKEIFPIVTNCALAAGVVGSVLWPQVQIVGAYDHRLPDWTGWARADAALVALVGAAVGAGLIFVTRFLGTLAFRREAMGIGDVYLMAAVGGVLGWEAAVLVFLIAPFFGLVYGIWHLMRKADHEVPYGPFLGLAAALVMVVQDHVVAYFQPGIAAMWQVFVGRG